MGGIDQAIIDALIAQHIFLLRFAAGEREAVLAILEKMEEELLERLQFKGKELSEATKADISTLLRQCQTVIGDYYKHVQERALGGLADLGQVEAQATASAFSTAFAVQIAPALPTEAYFRSLVKNTLIEGAPSADWWRGQDQAMQTKFANAVRQGLAASETNARIIQRIRRDVMPVARNHAAALVQTCVSTVGGAARMETYRQNDDLVTGYRQVSTLDSHTSHACVAYSGKAWDKDMKPIGHSLPFVSPKGAATGTPRHFNCRSVMVPTTKSYKELGIDAPEFRAETKAATGGPVSAAMSFDDFLKRKGDKFADDLLGKGRADLWRDGTITLSQLLDLTGRPLTLAQLRAKYQ
ncbi:phage minor head protein [Massilia sp. METH4]|uniref:phage minor head protein n=1 Tax=Massilia sp. METH4 TaxID=3123041 RepID=UPI0030CF338E